MVANCRLFVDRQLVDRLGERLANASPIEAKMDDLPELPFEKILS